MHCVLLANLAAVLSQHGPAIVYRRAPVPPDAVTQYWSSSRARLELWHQTMARYRNAEQSGHSGRLRQWWQGHVAVLEEVLVSDMLTRMVAAIALGMDQANDSDEISPVTHAVHLSHLEARNRVQQMMLYGRGNSVQDAVRLNRLRQAVERWTDAFLGRMSVRTPQTVHYAIDTVRASDYAEEMRHYGHGAARDTASWLMNAAMRDTLSRRTSKRAALPEANRNVASSVILMLRPDLFDSVGVLKSLWFHRMKLDHLLTDTNLNPAMLADSSEVQADEEGDSKKNPNVQRWYT